MTDRSLPRRRTAAALAAALVGLLAGLDAPRAAPAVGPTAAPVVGSPAMPVAQTPRPVAVEVVPDGGVLRRLPSIGRPTRLAGEIDALVFPVYLTAAEAAAGPRLRLTHLAAVSVMPEASRLSVSIDGRRVADLPIATTGSAKTVDLPLPPDLLHAGWNRVRIEADQRHRVECGTAATYELWTDVDRAHSGLVFATGFAPNRDGLADVAAVSPDESGRVAIRLVAGADPEPARLARGLRLAQAVALAGGFLDPVVSVERAPGKGPGIDLLLGSRALAADPSVDTGASRDDPASARLLLRVPEDAAGLDRMVAELTRAATDPVGSEAGRRARRALGGVAVTDGTTYRFSDFGVGSNEFGGRLFRTGFDLRMPADFYAGDYGKVTMLLTGGLAPGLERSSRLTVRVNGRQIAGTPLDGEHGEIFSDRRLDLPLTAFRPGRNRVEIEAAVPRGDDAVCDPSVQIDGPKRFLFVERGEVHIPTLAHAARLPDLSATAAGVLGSLDARLRPTLWVPRPDLATLSAVATLTTRIAVADGRVEVPTIAYRNPPSDAASAWVFGAFSDLPATIGGAVGLDTTAIHASWSRRLGPERVSDAAAVPGDPLARRAAALRLAAFDRGFDPIVTGSLPFRPANDGGTGDLVDEWRRSMENPWSPGALLRNAEARLGRALGPWIGGETPAPSFAPRASTGVVLAQALSADGGVWTLTTAATAATLFDGVVTLTDADRWSETTGDVAAWDRVDEKLETGATKPRAMFATRAPTPGNLRLVAAGWIGDHAIAFVVLALFAAALVGFATQRLLPHVGVRS